MVCVRVVAGARPGKSGRHPPPLIRPSLVTLGSKNALSVYAMPRKISVMNRLFAL